MSTDFVAAVQPTAESAVAESEPHAGVRSRTDDPEAADPWWRSAVVYQIYPRSFADSNGDGIGDLRGIIAHLDHLSDLGVDVLWLSPIYPSSGDDNGYDITDYQAIDPVFGSLEDFDELIAQVHTRGMKLLMDLVVNHTSDEHPWFVEAKSSPTSAKRDWYIWRPPRPGAEAGTAGAEPNNWSSFFAGSAWQFDPPSREYYLHLFSAKQPDLNWENPDVREAVHRMMTWWLDRGVDGFRMDVINLISKDQALPDVDLRPGELHGDGFPHYSYGPRIHEFLQQMRREVFHTRPGQFLTVGETPGATIDQARRYTDPSRAELDMVFHFEHVSIDHGPTGKFEPAVYEPARLKEIFQRWQNGLSPNGWNSLYWNNHDQPRVVSRFGDTEHHWQKSATALATALHLQRGTPFIYQGEEIGMTNLPFAELKDFRDIESIRYHAEMVASGLPETQALDRLRRMSRDNARSPMQWSDEVNAGFGTGTPWLPVNPNFATINAQAERGVSGSVLEHYKSLIELRHRLPVVADGDFSLQPSADHVFAFTRRLGEVSLSVQINLSAAPAERTETGFDDGEVILCNYPSATADPTLRPWEATVRLLVACV